MRAPGHRQPLGVHRAAAAVLFTLLVGVSTGCSPTDNRTVRWVGDDTGTSFGLALPLPTPGAPETVLVGMLCRTGTGAASVTGVTFDQSDGIEVTGFATRTRDAVGTTAGAESKALNEAGYDPRMVTIPTVCDDTDTTQVTDLAIQVTAAELRRVRGSGLTITYAAGANNGSLRIPMTLILCVGLPEGQQCAGE